ncbi:hypothetical protein [uncultured Tateyamaria sp.]|uniref:hypothetical protein n=1 Tax=Tateyamaria sp. 1078 TaxID=3417464 RepID=UPI00261CECE7|nr:hypothetical protein [uncultured Tateyamaria sp.]
MAFDTRRKKRECKLRINGAIRDRAQFDSIMARLVKQVASSGRTKPTGLIEKRGRRFPAFQIGTDIYRYSVSSGGKNFETTAYFIYERSSAP